MGSIGAARAALEVNRMKLRTVSFLLAILVAVCVLLPAFAAGNDDAVVNNEEIETEEVVADTEVETEPEPEPEQEAMPLVEKPALRTPFFLDGANLAELKFVCIDGVYYVTVASFVVAVAPETVVEELDGTVVVSAVSLREVEAAAGDETAVVTEETLDFSVSVGDRFVCVNDRYLYLDNGVVMIEEQIALPVDLLAKIFNLNIEQKKYTVRMTTADGGAYIENGSSYYDENLLYWLSRIIYSESGNQSLEGKIAVGNVVMNRLRDPKFPNTIKGVLFQKNQFSPAMSGSIYRKPNAESVEAAKMVLDGAVALEGVLFFNRVGMNTFASRNRTFVETIGAHSFYA